MKYSAIIINSSKTVRTIQELRIFLGIKNNNTIKSFLQRMKKEGILTCPYRGIRCRKSFDPLELGAKIKTKSYISLQTALQMNGIIFQDRSHTITLVSNNSLSCTAENIQIQIHKIKNALLTNPIGIINKGNYQIASPERAVCDMLYLDKQFYFDHISSLNTEILQEIKDIYPQSTQKSILSLVKQINHDQ